MILGIESSCDDCAVAILDLDGKVRADLIYSQIEPHAEFGGVVPELASRLHLTKISELCAAAFAEAKVKPAEIKAVAVTNRPGLIGSLLVGVQFAKGFAQGVGAKIIGVHHIEGHLLAGLGEAEFPEPPFVGLIVSGGHTALYLVNEKFEISLLGQTRDDAAGEAFDKIGRLLGLEYPAGKEVDRLAQSGDDTKYEFPRAFRSRDSLEYSFSGLKTAAKLMIEKAPVELPDFCASLQREIAQTLLAKARLALERVGTNKLVIGGGVAANSRLRFEAEKLQGDGFEIYLPQKKHCTDNAVMIAKAGWRKFVLGEFDGIDMPVKSS